MEDYEWTNGNYMIRKYQGEFVKDLFFYTIVSCKTGESLKVNPDTYEDAVEICRFFTYN